MALTLPLVVKANEQGFAPCDGGNCLLLCVCVCVQVCARSVAGSLFSLQWPLLCVD